jgi:CIC family chloride channel protein
MLSRQDGLDLPSMEEERELSVLRIEDAMRPPPDAVLNDEQTVDEAVKRAGHAKSDVLLVRRNPSGWSVVRKEELQKMASLGKHEMSLASLLPAERTPILHPDHPLDTALHYIYEWPIVPVVHRADVHHLEGVLTMADILRAYRNSGHEPEEGPQIP